MKRLTIDQKCYAVMDVLCTTKYPITPNQIAKAIGFQTGAAVHPALDHLHEQGFVTFYTGTFFDHPARWFYPTPAGRTKYCQLTEG